MKVITVRAIKIESPEGGYFEPESPIPESATNICFNGQEGQYTYQIEEGGE